jgi:hypothetical protein
MQRGGKRLLTRGGGGSQRQPPRGRGGSTEIFRTEIMRFFFCADVAPCVAVITATKANTLPVLELQISAKYLGSRLNRFHSETRSLSQAAGQHTARPARRTSALAASHPRSSPSLQRRLRNESVPCCLPHGLHAEAAWPRPPPHTRAAHAQSSLLVADDAC